MWGELPSTHRDPLSQQMRASLWAGSSPVALLTRQLTSGQYLRALTGFQTIQFLTHIRFTEIQVTYDRTQRCERYNSTVLSTITRFCSEISRTVPLTKKATPTVSHSGSQLLPAHRDPDVPLLQECVFWTFPDHICNLLVSSVSFT